MSGHLDRTHEAATEALREARTPRQPLALLAAAQGQHDEAIGHLARALDLATACAAPYERAVTLLDLAEAQLANGAP